jgi:hypothetical protein
MTNDSPDSPKPLGSRLAGFIRCSDLASEERTPTDLIYTWNKIDKAEIRASFLLMKSIIYSREISTRNGVEAAVLRATVENGGDTVIATFNDDPTILSKGKFAGWRKVIANLDQADQVVVGSIGDLPGRSVVDLLKILGVLNGHGVGLCLHREGINTDDGAAAIIDLVNVYKKVKLSETIRRGILKAKQAGKTPGRPKIPEQVRRNIQTALANGAGIRPCARRFRVSAGTVVNIKRTMVAEMERLAA